MSVLAAFARARVTSAPAPDGAAMFAAVPAACALIDRDNRFRAANPAAEEFFGISVAQLRHLALGDLVPADSALFAIVEQVRAGDVTVAERDLTLEGPRLS